MKKQKQWNTLKTKKRAASEKWWKITKYRKKSIESTLFYTIFIFLMMAVEQLSIYAADSISGGTWVIKRFSKAIVSDNRQWFSR